MVADLDTVAVARLMAAEAILETDVYGVGLGCGRGRVITWFLLLLARVTRLLRCRDGLLS